MALEAKNATGVTNGARRWVRVGQRPDKRVLEVQLSLSVMMAVAKRLSELQVGNTAKVCGSKGIVRNFLFFSLFSSILSILHHIGGLICTSEHKYSVHPDHYGTGSMVTI